MLTHHLWGFPDRVAGGTLKHLITFDGQPLILYLAYFAKICVSLYFFVGGYGMYISNKDRKFDPVKKLKKLYISYWKVFIVFIPIAFLFFLSQIPYCEKKSIYSRYNVFSIRECIENFLGVRSSYNGEWWFLYSYVIAVISFPLLRWIINRHSVIINIFMVLIGTIMVTTLFPAIGNIEIIGKLNDNYLYSHFFCQRAPFISCFWMGAVVAKDGLLNRLSEAMKSEKLLNPVTDILILGFIIYLRQATIGDILDVFFVPVLIVVSIDLLNRFRFLRKFFDKIGSQSTNMWLIHSFCCYYFYALVRIVVFPKWAVPSLLVLIAISYALSVLLTLFWKAVGLIIFFFEKRKKSENFI